MIVGIQAREASKTVKILADLLQHQADLLETPPEFRHQLLIQQTTPSHAHF